MRVNLQDFFNECHQRSKEAGWWRDPKTGLWLGNDPHVIGTKFALIHSEISEAFEGYRKDKMDDHLPHRKSVAVELGDALIRIGDLVGALDINTAEAVYEKMEYNAVRPDHKLEARLGKGGKKF